MAIARWEPFSELMPLRDMMNRLMEESFIMPRNWARTGEMMTPFPIDLCETENEVVLRAEMPGMRPEDIDVRVTENVLTIKGEHREEHEYPRQMAAGQTGQQMTGQQQGRQMSRQETPEQTWYRREIRYGTFSREITLPTPVQADQARASFENGVLTLTLPKAEEAKARRIQVQGQTGQSGQPKVQTGR